MTVYRTILKVRTIGSRVSGDLRPAFMDNFGNDFPGIGYSVLEYDEAGGTCVLEASCSDNPAQPPGGARPKAALSAVAKHPAVLSTLSSHPNSPHIICSIGTVAPDSVNEDQKTITVKGNTGPYLRKEVVQTSQGPVVRYIVDEG